MSTKTKLVAQNPLILRCHRIMEAFAKSDDERDFYVDRQEGFLIYIDLDKSQEELDELNKELNSDPDRYCPIPKLTYYEIKKVMEGFVNEKVYDIDTKEKLLDIIQSKEARENFLEFIYDHHTELEKWQQYYQERFRVRIIEWLRNNQFDFVFEEDLELTKSMVERLKMNLFTSKVGKDIAAQRKVLAAKAKTYYSNEALNPRPKRGRPPKQVAKVETEPQFSQDIFTTIPKAVKPFVFSPDYHGASAIFTFSGKFASEADLLAHRRQQISSGSSLELQNIQQKLTALRTLSTTWSIGSKEGHAPTFFDEEQVRVEPVRNEEKVAVLKKSSFAPKAAAAKASVKKVAKPAPKAAKKKVEVKKPAVKVAKGKVAPKVASKAKAPAKPVAKSKVVAKKPVVKAKSAPKARLRPLQKKAKPVAVIAKKTKPVVKAKTPERRHLRATKKKGK